VRTIGKRKGKTNQFGWLQAPATKLLLLLAIIFATGDDPRLIAPPGVKSFWTDK